MFKPIKSHICSLPVCTEFIPILLHVHVKTLVFVEANPDLDENAFLFGLLASDAQCFRLARANLYTYPSEAEDLLLLLPPRDLTKLRWHCLSWTLLEPSTSILKDRFFALWNWFKSLRFALSSTSTGPSSADHASTEGKFYFLPQLF